MSLGPMPVSICTCLHAAWRSTMTESTEALNLSLFFGSFSIVEYSDVT
jgi:hypothetical protein